MIMQSWMWLYNFFLILEGNKLDLDKPCLDIREGLNFLEDFMTSLKAVNK